MVRLLASIFIALLLIFPIKHAHSAVYSTQETVKLSVPTAAEEPAPSLMEDDDSDFAIITNVHDETISETAYETIVKDLQKLFESILQVQRSQSRKFAVIQTIYDWYDDPKGRFAIPWKDHVFILKYILSRRAVHDYIPDSIIKHYMNFFVEKIVIPSRVNFSTTAYKLFVQEMLELVLALVKAAVKAPVLENLLEVIHRDFSALQIKSLFITIHASFDFLEREIRKMAPKEQVPRFNAIIRLYLTFLSYLNLNLREYSGIKTLQRTPASFKVFVDLVPLFRTFLLDRTDESLYKRFLVRPDSSRRREYLKMINMFLDESRFNDNLLFDPHTFEHKRQVFSLLRFSLFQDTQLIEILEYLVTHGLMHLYNAFLIYSRDEEFFTESLLVLLELILTRENISIGIYASIVAVCPELSIEILDLIASNLQNPQDINMINFNGLKRIILATENIPFIEKGFVSVWDIPPSLKLDEDDFEACKPFFFQAARIFLFRQFRIPFTHSTFRTDTFEEADWIHMIGFLNFFIERECSRHSIWEIPQISTNDK